MADDIVEQLRLLRPTAKFEYAKDQFLMVGVVMREAATEIERLRTLLSANDTTSAYRCIDCGSWHVKLEERQ